MTDTLPIARRVLQPFGQFGRAAFRFVFPPSCPLCHGDVEMTELDACGRPIVPLLCGRCTADMQPPAGERCQRCGLPVGPFVFNRDGCPNCRSQEFRFQRVIRAGLYENALRRACIRAKASTQFPLAAALANLLWVTEREDFEAEQADLVVPVPRHWSRRIIHSHHAAETMSRVLSWRLGKPHRRTLLHKVRFTPDQSDLTAAQRKLNLKKAFVVWPRPRSLVGKTVLLVDDILTTGTTANECARVLLRAGAKRVVVAVIAVVPSGSR